MRKVIASIFISVDGVFEDPSWSMPFWNDEAATFAGEQLAASDALLLGRVTHEGMSEAWTARDDSDDPGTDRMNSLPKYVATSTLDTPVWNASFLTGDLAAEVTALKQEDGGDLLIYL
ncbi:dihydrofolate reductase family protein [Streptomyces sp. NPDC003042]